MAGNIIGAVGADLLGIAVDAFPNLLGLGAAIGIAGEVGKATSSHSRKSNRGSMTQSQISNRGTKRKFSGNLRHRAINSGVNTNRTNMSTSHSGGRDEVDVVPPPSRISKTVPDYFTINLPYAEAARLDASAISDQLVYRLNSINDPNFTGSSDGHNPMGTAQWKTIYQYYRVLSSSFKFTFLNKSTETVVVGYEVRDSKAESLGALNPFMESKQTAHVMLSGTTAASGGSNTVSMTFHYSPDSFDHHVREIDSEERWTPVDNVPNIPHFIIPRVFSFSGGSVIFNVDVMVEIIYTCQYRESITSILTSENARVADP